MVELPVTEQEKTKDSGRRGLEGEGWSRVQTSDGCPREDTEWVSEVQERERVQAGDVNCGLQLRKGTEILEVKHAYRENTNLKTELWDQKK